MPTPSYAGARDRSEDGATLRLYLDDIHAVAVCGCGLRSFGDSLNDAVTAWLKHVTGSTCREDLA